MSKLLSDNIWLTDAKGRICCHKTYRLMIWNLPGGCCCLGTWISTPKGSSVSMVLVLSVKSTLVVKDEDGCRCVLQIAGNKALELLLTCSVPKLHSDCAPLVVHILYQEVNPYRRLCIPQKIRLNWPKNCCL